MEWQQPNQPCEVAYNKIDTRHWSRVLFIRATLEGGWEAISVHGTRWDDTNASIRFVDKHDRQT